MSQVERWTWHVPGTTRRPARQRGGASSPSEMGRTTVDGGVICSYVLKGSPDAVLRTVCSGWVVKGRSGKSV